MNRIPDRPANGSDRQDAVRAAIGVCFLIIGAMIAASALPIALPLPLVFVGLALAPLAGVAAYAAIARTRGGERR